MHSSHQETPFSLTPAVFLDSYKGLVCLEGFELTLETQKVSEKIRTGCFKRLSTSGKKQKFSSQKTDFEVAKMFEGFRCSG